MSETAETLKVLLYSDNRAMREDVRLTLGRRIAKDLPELEYHEIATPDVVIREMDANPNYDLIILDGEARPMGGMGMSRQLHEEYPNLPPIVLFVDRVQDAWLATWSGADLIASFPVDPIGFPEDVAELLRKTVAVS